MSLVPRCLPVVVVVALAAAPGSAIAGQPSPAPTGVSEERIAELEARVAELEAFLAANMDFGTEAAAARVAEGKLALPVVVTRKHFQQKDPAHARWEDYLDLDVEYDTSALDRPATALKGTLVFTDSFGEVRFELPMEVTDRIEPGAPLRQKNVRFKYNQFRSEHQWMHGTEPKNMVVAMRLSAVMYRDGTTVEYR